MSSEKSKTMEFLGKDPVRCKITVGNKYLQLKNCEYFNCEVSYKYEKYVQQN
jgi:hypothetical protein